MTLKNICLLLFIFISVLSFSQYDSLTQLLQSQRLKKMSFGDLISIQNKYTTLDKELRIAFTNELLNRKDLMAIEKQRAEAYLLVGKNYQFMGDDFAKAKYYLDESLRIYSRLKILAKKAEVIRALAVYHHSRDEDSLAITLYTKSQQIAEQAKDTLGILRPYAGICFMYTKVGLYDKAIAYGLEGIKRAKQYKDSISLAFISNNTGNAYLKKGNYDTAIVLYKTALAINKDAENIIRNSSNIGNAYLFLNLTDSATKYLNKAELLLPQIDVPRALIFAYSYIAKLRNVKQQYTQAASFANKAVALSKQNQLESISDVALEALVYSYKQLKMPDSAFAALENYWAIKQKFLETNRNKTVAQVEQQFQQYKKDIEISLLKKDKEIGKKLRNGAIILASLLALTAFLFYNRYRLKKKSSDILANKNSEIELQKAVIQSSLSEKETLLREIHHRVKNNLQIISSLLNLQSQHITDENTLNSIQEGQSRVQAMSLIHQNLYQSEQVSNVDIENYIKELVAHLAQMFVGQEKNITVNVNAPQINFDIDTAIPLGLIINELVSNAYKYAFNKHTKGQINISIKPIGQAEYLLNINDDGKGLPVNTDVEKGKSMGLKLVKILCKQLRGSFTSKTDNGAVFLVTFKDLRAFNAL